MNQKKQKKKKLILKNDEWEIDPESDHPIHEQYTKMEPMKE